MDLLSLLTAMIVYGYDTDNSSAKSDEDYLCEACSRQTVFQPGDNTPINFGNDGFINIGGVLF
ncbi:hypothetical protein KFU94_45570 [Chloroflexi bacterium TSY]|nr:hypothetical protein [Chloroflexi bacterium TSY]